MTLTCSRASAGMHKGIPLQLYLYTMGLICTSAIAVWVHPPRGIAEQAGGISSAALLRDPGARAWLVVQHGAWNIRQDQQGLAHNNRACVSPMQVVPARLIMSTGPHPLSKGVLSR